MKIISISFLVLGIYFVSRVECKPFDKSAARKQIIAVFDYMKPMFGNGDLKLKGYKSSINAVETPEELATTADNKLTNAQITALKGMAQINRNGLISKIEEFEGKYNTLLTESDNADKTVPFQSLKSDLASGTAEATEATEATEESDSSR